MNSLRPANLLCDPSSSHWLIDALKTALTRDPIDAAADAAALAEALAGHADDVLADALRAIQPDGSAR